MTQFLDDLSWLGMTKADLAEELGVARETVSVWGTNPPRYAVAYVSVRRRLRSRDKELARCERVLERMRLLLAGYDDEEGTWS